MIRTFERRGFLPGISTGRLHIFLLTLLLAHTTIGQSLNQNDVRPIVGRNVIHTVKAGESMFTIAQKYGLAVDHLTFANGYSPVTVELDPGETIIVPRERILPKNPPHNGLVLNLPERGVYFFSKRQIRPLYSSVYR